MKMTEEKAREMGFNWMEEIDGKEYMINTNLDPHYTPDGSVSYFYAVQIGAGYDGIEMILVGYPKRDIVPEEPNEWSDIYDDDAPFIY